MSALLSEARRQPSCLTRFTSWRSLLLKTAFSATDVQCPFYGTSHSDLWHLATKSKRNSRKKSRQIYKRWHTRRNNPEISLLPCFTNNSIETTEVGWHIQDHPANCCRIIALFICLSTKMLPQLESNPGCSWVRKILSEPMKLLPITLWNKMSIF